LVRVNNDRTLKKIFNTKRDGARSVGRPKLWWEDGVDQDMRILGVKNGKKVALNRDEWAQLLKKAGAHQGCRANDDEIFLRASWRGVCALTWSFMSTSNFAYVCQVCKIQPFLSDCLNLEEGTNQSSQNVIITTSLCLITSQRAKISTIGKLFRLWSSGLLFWILCLRGTYCLCLQCDWISLTLILLTWRIWWVPNNASKWQMGFNSAFKGLRWMLQWLREGNMSVM
jgi:hypothetical protein